MANKDEITVQGYEAPDQVDIKVKEEIPSPPGGASRWAEFTEDKPQWGNASWWGNVGERAKAVLPYLKDNAKTYGAMATDVWAKDILPNAVGKVYGGLTGVDSEDDYEDYDVDESRMPPLGPHYRPQSLDDYIVRRRDMKPSIEDVMSGRASVGGQMDYLNPSREYPGMLEAGALADVDASEAEVGRGGRFLGNLLNRLQGDFETSDKEDENAYRKALAAGQGALGYLSDTLPDQLEALAGEGGARLGMAALGPAFIKAKKAILKRDKLINKLYKDKQNVPRFPTRDAPYDDNLQWYDTEEVVDDLWSGDRELQDRLFINDRKAQAKTFKAIEDASKANRNAEQEVRLAREGRELFNKRYPSSWSHAEGTRRPEDILPTEQANEFYKQMARDMRDVDDASRKLLLDRRGMDPNDYERALDNLRQKAHKTTANGVAESLERATDTRNPFKNIPEKDLPAVQRTLLKRGRSKYYDSGRDPFADLGKTHNGVELTGDQYYINNWPGMANKVNEYEEVNTAVNSLPEELWQDRPTIEELNRRIREMVRRANKAPSLSRPSIASDANHAIVEDVIAGRPDPFAILENGDVNSAREYLISSWAERTKPRGVSLKSYIDGLNKMSDKDVMNYFDTYLGQYFNF